jgi:uncharacterized protein
MSPHVLSSLVRIATHPKIFKHPSGTAEVIHFADTLLEAANCRIIEPGQRHWSIFRELCNATKASGNVVPDAWLAALAIEHGCVWITADFGFAKFPGLRWRTID